MRRSAARLREKLEEGSVPLRLYQSEVFYHAQVKYTCLLLDIVDDYCDDLVADAITDRICALVVGPGAMEAVERMRLHQAEYLRRMSGQGT